MTNMRSTRGLIFFSSLLRLKYDGSGRGRAIEVRRHLDQRWRRHRSRHYVEAKRRSADYTNLRSRERKYRRVTARQGDIRRQPGKIKLHGPRARGLRRRLMVAYPP